MGVHNDPVQPPGGQHGAPSGRFSPRTLLLVILTAVITYTVTTLGHQYQFRNARELQRLAEAENIGRLLTVIRLVEEQYVEEVPLEQLVDGAAAGIIESLSDPYSVFFGEEEYQAFEINLTGEYEGIGVIVTEKDGFITVQTPFPGTPGATTYPEGVGPDDDFPPGLLPGDKIIEIDGRNVTGLPVTEAAKLIRGPKNSQVHLSVSRPQEGNAPDLQLQFLINREHIEVPTVESRMLTPEIGYVWLSMFTKATPRDMIEAMERLWAEGARALVLDLRNNPGGDLGASVDVASQFVPEGPVVHVERRSGERESLMSRSPAITQPFVVLVNNASASASEIVAGAIQDYGTGVLIGEETFGKGSVQTVWSLNKKGLVRSSQEGEDIVGVKMTTAKYLTPKERSIHGEGIKPDVIVEQPGNALFGSLDSDLQLQKAVEILEQKLNS